MKPNRRHLHLSAALAAGAILSALPVLGQNVVRAEYDFAAAVASIDTDPNTSASNFANGPGLTGGSRSGTSFIYFVRELWTPAGARDLASAIASDSYLTFTLTNTSGGPIDLSVLQFDYWQQPLATGEMAVLTSLTGFTAGDALFTQVAGPGTTTASGTSPYQVLLDDAAFKGIADTTAVEFRLYLWDQTENNPDIHRFDNIKVSTLDPVMGIDSTSPNSDLAFGTTFAAAPGGLANRTLRYVNSSSTNDIEIQDIVLNDDGGGVFSLVSTPSLPHTLLPGATFDVEVSATSAASTTGDVSGELFIDTDEDGADNPQDKTVAISATFYPPFSILIDNPTFDSGRDGWTPGAPTVAPGPASAGGVRLKGKGDIGGPSTVPDTISNSIPSGASDFELTFKFAILDDTVIPNYTGGLAPDGDYLERAMQFVLFGNNSGTPGNNTISDAFMANATVNIAYFYDGVFSGGDEGFYAFDGTDWVHLPGLGTLEGSIDGPDGSVDSGSDATGSPIAISGAALAANVVTVTTASDHGYGNGNSVTVEGLGFTTTDPNGTFTITSVPTPDSFTFALTGADESFTAASATVTGPPDLGDGILDPDDPNDTVNVYEMRVAATGLGTGSASYSVSISGANTIIPAATVGPLTYSNSIPLTDPGATPSALSFTTGDDSLASGNGGASTLNGYNTSWWLDEAYVWSGSAPDPVMLVTGDLTIDLFDGPSSGTSTLTVTNGGVGNNLSVSAAAITGIGFSIDPPFAMQVLPPGDSLDITVKFDSTVAGLAPGGVANASLEITSDADVDPVQTLTLRGSVTDFSELLKDGGFEVLSPDDNRRFTGWSNGTVASIQQVPGLVSGSPNACYLSTTGPWVVNRFESGVSDFESDVYFAFKDTINRQFNLLVGTTSNLTFPLNIAITGGVLQTFQGPSGAGGAFANVLTPSPAMSPSVDADQNGSLDDAGDTKNVYRLHVNGSDWGTPSASYELELFDVDESGVSPDVSLGNSGTLTAFRTDNDGDLVYSEGAGVLRISSEFGTNPGFWADEASFSGMLVVPGTDVTITSVTRSGNLLTIGFTGEAGMPGAFTVTGSPDLTTAFATTDVTIDTAVTEGAAGEYTVVLDVSGNGSRYFFRIEN